MLCLKWVRGIWVCTGKPEGFTLTVASPAKGFSPSLGCRGVREQLKHLFLIGLCLCKHFLPVCRIASLPPPSSVSTAQCVSPWNAHVGLVFPSTGLSADQHFVTLGCSRHLSLGLNSKTGLWKRKKMSFVLWWCSFSTHR